MSLVKYKLKEVATDFGVTPKDIADVMGKFFEKPKSNTQVLTEEELNVVFDYMTQINQISSLEAVYAVQPKAEEKKEEPKAEKPAPKAEQKPAPKAEERSLRKLPRSLRKHPRNLRPRQKRPSLLSRSVAESAAWWIPLRYR